MQAVVDSFVSEGDAFLAVIRKKQQDAEVVLKECSNTLAIHLPHASPARFCRDRAESTVSAVLPDSDIISLSSFSTDGKGRLQESADEKENIFVGIQHRENLTKPDQSATAVVQSITLDPDMTIEAVLQQGREKLKKRQQELERLMEGSSRNQSRVHLVRLEKAKLREIVPVPDLRRTVQHDTHRCEINISESHENQGQPCGLGVSPDGDTPFPLHCRKFSHRHKSAMSTNLMWC
jgi:hypothetical protein